MWLLSGCGDNAVFLLDPGIGDDLPVEATEVSTQRLPSPTSSTAVVPTAVTPTAVTPTVVTPTAVTPTAVTPEPLRSRGYLTTPAELVEIARKAEAGVEPYATAVAWVIEEADTAWEYELLAEETCPDAHSPSWNDNGSGTATLWAKALAYHLTGQAHYAEEVKQILQRIMTEVETIDLAEKQCELNFAWGTPELVATADLIEDYWYGQECTGPLSTVYDDTTRGTGDCKTLFQNWLVKNPYYIVSYTAQAATSNWGAAGTTATAYIADYLWDREDVMLIQRNPDQINNGAEVALTPAEAYALANQVAIDRMNGYRVSYGSVRSCDRLTLNTKQSSKWDPVKSQITQNGILPDDARRTESCNIPGYKDKHDHNYPQLHLGNLIQQCELMLRRGDRSCYDNVDNTDIPDYTYVDQIGIEQTTHLYPGRGSIERAINAIIVDAGISWQHDSALEVAYRYYFVNHTMPGFEEWPEQLGRKRARCINHICFGLLTHGFASDEIPQAPPTVPPPGADEESSRDD